MTQLRAATGILAVGAVVFLSPACSSEGERPPYVSDGEASGAAPSQSGGSENGGEGGEASSGGRTPSGGRSSGGSGGARTSGGASSGGTGTGGASFSFVRVSRFNPDYSLSSLHWAGVGTVSSYLGGGWLDADYTGEEPVAVSTGATAYRVAPSGDDKDMTTFTVSVPPLDLEAIGVLPRDNLAEAFAQLQAFDEANAEQAQLVVFVHDQLGQPLEGAVPEAPGAREVAYYTFEVWDDQSEQTGPLGLFWAANVNGSEFQSGGYAFSVTAFQQRQQVSVPMKADALTFVDLEFQRP